MDNLHKFVVGNIIILYIQYNIRTFVCNALVIGEQKFPNRFGI